MVLNPQFAQTSSDSLRAALTQRWRLVAFSSAVWFLLTPTERSGTYVAKDVPERRLVSSAALEKSKYENQQRDGQISLFTGISLVTVNDDRDQDMIGFGTEA